MKRRIGAGILLTALGLVMAVAVGWGALVFWYLGPGPDGLRKGLAWTFTALGLAVQADPHLSMVLPLQ